MRSIVPALSAMAMLLATTSVAETARAKAPLASVPAKTAPVQTAPAADPGRSTRQALVRKYFAAIQFDKLLDAMTESLLQQQMAGLGENSRLTPEIQTALVTSATDTMRDIRPDVMERYTEMYADVLTEPELAALVSFYESDLGRSITGKSQLLAVQAGPLLGEFMPRIQSGMRRRLCAQIACPAETSAAK